MAGTKAGGKAAASTNKTKYGSDFYAKIGAMGGKKGRTGGFFANRDLARQAGAKGGRLCHVDPKRGLPSSARYWCRARRILCSRCSGQPGPAGQLRLPRAQKLEQ